MKRSILLSQGFKLDKSSKEIQFQLKSVGTVFIDYRVDCIPKDNVILLSFYPKPSKSSDYDPTKWRKTDIVKIAAKTVEFCNLLGNSLSVYVRDHRIQFNRVIFSKYIDISKWKVSIFGKREMALPEVLSSRAEIYKFIKDYAQTKNYTFILFSSDYKYILESYSKEENVVAIFIENRDDIKIIYKIFKKYLDLSNIPSQFISMDIILENFEKIKLNLLLELFSKAEDRRKPLFLQPVSSLLNNIDGVLCLSDVKDASTYRYQKLFGALFMHIEPTAAYDKVHVYADIHYDINGGYIVFKDDDSIKRLAEYVNQLVGSEKIDIILTKPWKKENLEMFIDQLSNFKHKINKIYYISTIKLKFTDNAIVSSAVNESDDNSNKYKHPYTIISDTIAFVRTNTHLEVYPQMFNVYVELLWPDSERIDEEDIEKIIWLSKRRIYRFNEFFGTKIPEPMAIFNNIQKMYLGKSIDKIKIPLWFMI